MVRVHYLHVNKIVNDGGKNIILCNLWKHNDFFVVRFTFRINKNTSNQFVFFVGLHPDSAETETFVSGHATVTQIQERTVPRPLHRSPVHTNGSYICTRARNSWCGFFKRRKRILRIEQTGDRIKLPGKGKKKVLHQIWKTAATLIYTAGTAHCDIW